MLKSAVFAKTKSNLAQNRVKFCRKMLSHLKTGSNFAKKTEPYFTKMCFFFGKILLVPLNNFAKSVAAGNFAGIDFAKPKIKFRSKQDFTCDSHFDEVAEQGDGLDGFTETHLVGQDAVNAVLVQSRHPLIAFDLEKKHHK